MVRPRCPATSRFWLLVSLALFGPSLSGCKEDAAASAPPEAEEEARDPITGLSAVEAAEVLATVGDRRITLGDYASSLARMDEFERLRYQSEERQKQLLEEMIQLEILAQEARQRGLDKDPEVQLRIQQALRDELLQELRRSLPKPEQISEREVRAHYDAHRSEYQEPLRHRVLVIVTATEAVARRVIGELEGQGGAKWAQLAAKHSRNRTNLGPGEAEELAGDLGFVSAPGVPRGHNPAVPEPVRAAVFQLAKVGETAPEPVKAEDGYYVVRLGGISPARERSLRDADSSIRAELLRQKFLQAEKELEAELEKRYPVTIDETALARAQEPTP